MASFDRTRARRHWLIATATSAVMLTVGHGSSSAQPASEAAPAFDAFDLWIGEATSKVPALTAPAGIEPLELSVAKGGVPTAPFEPQPVILGAPELPLLGAGARQPGRVWNTGFNYHGLQVQLLTWDARSRSLKVASMGAKLKRGQPFKVRITATFDGVAALEQVLGPEWRSVRAGQVYPQPGMSVEFKAAQPVDLPIGAQQFIVLPAGATQARLLLTARHARAQVDGRSQQPVYRRDRSDASAYLQLVPRGQSPVFEQLVGAVR